MNMLAPMTTYRPVRAIPDRDWMSRKEAAAYLCRIGYRIAPQTLANMAARDNAGEGPPFVKSRGRIVQYARAELDRWMREHVIMVR